MATTPTKNSVPSESPIDLKFNAGKIDEFVTSLALQYFDRFGGAHYTIEGLKKLVLQQIYNLGWNLVGTFQGGATVSSAGDIIQDETTGVWYRWDDLSTLPKDVPAGSTPASTGGIGEGKWLAVDVSDVLRKEYEKTQWNNFIYNFGGVPDYTGTPLYDGNDATRITATDNSPMLQDALNNGEVRNGVLHIYFPAGHYGFKTDGVAKVASSNVHTVIFHGESFGSTTLDFIFERSDTIGTNVQPSNASMIARLTGFKHVIWESLNCKCTTKSGTIDGSTDPSADNPSVYYGAVWFAHMQDCENVRFEKTKMQRGNYRGFSVDAQNLPIGYRTKVSIVNCEGFDNTSTGYWLSFCNSLYVQGGQFYHNGTKGFLATGYGIAASQYVDDILIVGGATFYENYRKGFDRHGGVGSMVISGAVFADNLLRDIEDNKQCAPGDR